MFKKINYFILLFIISGNIFGQVISEWRGIGRTGVYENEKKLLKSWGENGPELLWSIDSLPSGYSSVAVVNDKIYTTGIKDTMDVLTAIDATGKILWHTPFGRAWTESFSDSRGTPTIDGSMIYVVSGKGDIACIHAENGNIIWKKKASEEFGSVFDDWGISESLLINENKVFYTTAGNQTTMIALDKITGELIWKSESLKDVTSYISPILINHNDKKLIISATENYIFGVEPETGKISWTFDFGKYSEFLGDWKAAVNSNTPLYYKGELYITSGYNHKSVKLKLNQNADNVTIAWIDSTLDVHHGGVVRIGEYIYGANWLNNGMGSWVCLEWDSGKVMYEHKWENKGSIISADGMLYCYEEKRGNIALVEATPESFNIVSTFKIPLGKGPHWAHLVIDNGKLYVRHGTAIMVYNILNK